MCIVRTNETIASAITTIGMGPILGLSESTNRASEGWQ